MQQPKWPINKRTDVDASGLRNPEAFFPLLLLAFEKGCEFMKQMKIILRRMFDRFFLPLTKRLVILEQRSLINAAFSRASATMQTRIIDPTDPLSWEFSGFSQSGEDGILDYLAGRFKNKTRYFIDIGASEGINSNTAWFARARNFTGLMIDGNRKSIESGWKTAQFCTELVCLFVDKDSVETLKKLAVHLDPDIFSLDIDGNDYYVARAIMEAGFRPGIFIVEYNSAFGPRESITIDYKKDFNNSEAHASQLYYGVSISGWKTFFKRWEYAFVTVDSNGVNAIFIDRRQFDPGFAAGLKGLQFAENFYQRNKFKCGWEQQFELIKDMNYVSID
jgi:hypothetical protein